MRTKFEDGVYTVEGIRIGVTAWCTQAGLIFSIDQVIIEVAAPNLLEQTLGKAIYIVFFQDPFFSVITALGLAAFPSVRERLGTPNVVEIDLNRKAV